MRSVREDCDGSGPHDTGEEERSHLNLSLSLSPCSYYAKRENTHAKLRSGENEDHQPRARRLLCMSPPLGEPITSTCPTVLESSY